MAIFALGGAIEPNSRQASINLLCRLNQAGIIPVAGAFRAAFIDTANHVCLYDSADGDTWVKTDTGVVAPVTGGASGWCFVADLSALVYLDTGTHKLTVLLASDSWAIKHAWNTQPVGSAYQGFQVALRSTGELVIVLQDYNDPVTNDYQVVLLRFNAGAFSPLTVVKTVPNATGAVFLNSANVLSDDSVFIVYNPGLAYTHYESKILDPANSLSAASAVGLVSIYRGSNGVVDIGGKLVLPCGLANQAFGLLIYDQTLDTWSVANSLDTTYNLSAADFSAGVFDGSNLICIYTTMDPVSGDEIIRAGKVLVTDDITDPTKWTWETGLDLNVNDPTIPVIVAPYTVTAFTLAFSSAGQAMGQLQLRHGTYVLMSTHLVGGPPPPPPPVVLGIGILDANGGTIPIMLPDPARVCRMRSNRAQFQRQLQPCKCR